MRRDYYSLESIHSDLSSQLTTETWPVDDSEIVDGDVTPIAFPDDRRDSDGISRRRLPQNVHASRVPEGNRNAKGRKTTMWKTGNTPKMVGLYFVNIKLSRPM